MKVKIDTKEKFHIVALNEADFSDNIAADLSNVLTKFLHTEVRNVVLKLGETQTIEDTAAQQLVQLQQLFYESNASFVICEVQPGTEEKLEQLELLEVMNITRTESEAWDIVQMEEIERELMDDDNGEPLNLI